MRHVENNQQTGRCKFYFINHYINVYKLDTLTKSEVRRIDKSIWYLQEKV